MLKKPRFSTKCRGVDKGMNYFGFSIVIYFSLILLQFIYLFFNNSTVSQSVIWSVLLAIQAVVDLRRFRLALYLAIAIGFIFTVPAFLCLLVFFTNENSSPQIAFFYIQIGLNAIFGIALLVVSLFRLGNRIYPEAKPSKTGLK